MTSACIFSSRHSSGSSLVSGYPEGKPSLSFYYYHSSAGKLFAQNFQTTTSILHITVMHSFLLWHDVDPLVTSRFEEDTMSPAGDKSDIFLGTGAAIGVRLL